jgi:putative flippase GtrA
VTKKIGKFFDKRMLIFLLIGAGNALLTILLMYGMFELLHYGYWISSAIAFTICSVISFILNRKYTFKNKDAVWLTAIKFALVIAVCYFIAYWVAQPITEEVFTIIGVELNQADIQRIALLVGQIVFTGMNYLGQRFFAFSNRRKNEAV